MEPKIKFETKEIKCIKVRGGKALSGSVSPDGAKNSALIQLAASAILEGGWVTLENVPMISDVYDEVEMLNEIGLITKHHKNQVLIAGEIKSTTFSYEFGSRIRASLVFLGSVLARKGEIVLPMPGGDKIGERPIDIHMDVMKAFDIDAEIIGGFIHAKARSFPLKATSIYLRFPSVLATVNAILLGVLATGTSIIENAAMEPEIVDCTNLLLKMGADIVGVGTNRIIIKGVKSLCTATHDIMPDRLESAALLMSIVMTEGSGIVKNIIPEHNRPLIHILDEIGVDLEVGSDFIHVKSAAINKGFQIETRPYPGFATDLQPLITTLALKGKSESVITDTIFKERFAHVNELRKMGADIQRYDNTIKINPYQKLTGAEVTGTDIRAVVSLINASLIIADETAIYGIEHLNRGHANFVEKLKSLNADIQYV